MAEQSKELTEKSRTEIWTISFIILLYLFRTSLPILKFPFLLLYLGFSFYLLIRYYRKIISSLMDFGREYYLILLLALILVFSFLLSNKIYLIIFKDVINMVILLSLYFILKLVVSGRRELNFLVLKFSYLIIFFAFVITISVLFDLLNIFPSLTEISSGSSDDSVSVDNNFALLPIFFGFIGILYLLQKQSWPKLKILYFNVFLIAFSFSIILSGSRRGLFTFSAIILFLLFAQVSGILKMNTFLRKIADTSRYFLISLFLLLIISTFIAFKADYTIKIKLLEISGSRNLPDTKEKIALKMYKYASIFEDQLSFEEFYSRIWPTIPEDPDSGWGTRIHKTIYPLAGKNVEIVPSGSKGYLLDSTCNAAYYSSTDISEAFTLIKSFNVSQGDRFRISVYCYVSDSFDIDVANLTVKYSCIDNGIVSGKATSFYDFNNIGSWQKLEIEFYSNMSFNEVPVFMSCLKKGVKDFRKLKGYIIFAYPQYEKILPDSIEIKIDSIQDKVVSTISSNRPKYFSSSIFYFHKSLLLYSDTNPDFDPLRNLVSKLISEDTTYYPYRSTIVLDTISNSFISDRVSRWKFGLKLFSSEYNLKQKFFGNGFNFLNWYGYYFYRDKTRSDYPHNPFITVLLYSGLLGLILYMIFMYKVFYYYIKYLKEYKIFAIFFSITFYFSFFSAGSPFDPPVMGFFVLLPFFIHSVHKEKKSESSGDKLNSEKHLE